MNLITNGCGKLDTLAKVYKGLNGDLTEIIKNAINNNTDGSCLLQFLIRANDVDLPHPALELLLKNYDQTCNVFNINGQRLNVTLQDILYITGLPIHGEAVTTSQSRNKTAFRETLGVDKESISMTDLQKIATDGDKTIDQRMTAVFLLIIACIIIPSADVKTVTSAYVEFVRDRSRINSYAWGAALLAYLYEGLRRGIEDADRKRDRKRVKGNLWVVLCFFLVRIPKLAPAMLVKVEGSDLDQADLDQAMKDKFEDVRKNAPMFYNIIDEVLPISHDHHYPCLPRVKDVIDNLSSSDVTWSPYEQTLLPPALIEQQRRVMYLGPIICLNYVTYHRPIDVPGQFAVEFGRLDFEKVIKMVKKSMDIEGVKQRENKGSHNLNFKDIFKKEIKFWDAGETVEGHLLNKNRPKAKKKRPCTDGDGDGDGGRDGGRAGDGDGDGDHVVYQHVNEEDTNGGDPEPSLERDFTQQSSPIAQENDILCEENVAANEVSVVAFDADDDFNSSMEDARVTSPHPSSPPKNDDNVKKKNKRKDACLEGGQVPSNLPNKRLIKKRKELNVDITGIRDQRTPSSIFSPSGRKPPLKGKRTKAKKA